MEWQEGIQRGEKEEGIHGRVDCPENDMGIDRCLCGTSSGNAEMT